MKLLLTRDSICAADDLESPHSLSISIADRPTLQQIVWTIRRSDYLPSISGGKASWVACSNVPIGVIAEQWQDPRTIWMISPGMEELDWVDGDLRVHISYLDQVDPELVMKVVEKLRLKNM
jgi:hypothetical protein